MNPQRKRYYLDNAATSFPKPDVVYEAVDHYQRELGGAVGRGATQTGAAIQRLVDQTRSAIAQLLGVPQPRQVVFTFNGTDSLNLVLHGLLAEGDRVVTSAWEHNSVLRPLKFLSETRNVRSTFLANDDVGRIDLDDLKQQLATGTRLVCITHASNVTGVIQPVSEIVELAHQAGALVLLDAAQTAGHLPISMKDLGVDFLACPGHKGLLGPLGTGVLAIRPGLENELASLRQGGTGTTSESESQPQTLPEKYESGNHNAPGIVGLGAAVNWIADQTVESIQQLEEKLVNEFLNGLRGLPQVSVIFGEDQIDRVGLVSLVVDHIEPQTLSTLLDEHFGIETRAGLHCAPRTHEAIGTKSTGGTTRFSFGPFNTQEDVDFTLESLAQITSAI